MTPSEFFVPLDNTDTPYAKLCERLRGLDASSFEKVEIFAWCLNTVPDETDLLRQMRNSFPTKSNQNWLQFRKATVLGCFFNFMWYTYS